MTALVLMLLPGVLMAQVKHVEKTVYEETCKQALEVSEEQRAQLGELKLEQQIASIKLGAELKILNIQLKQELAKDDPSAKELDNLVSKIYATKQKLHKGKIDLQLKMRKILPKQWKHLKGCCGGMGTHGSMMMDCMGGGCGEMGGQMVKKMIISGAGGCGSGTCSSMSKGCSCKCCAHMTGGSCCSGGMKGCSSAKSSCKDIETKVIKIESSK